MSTPWGGSEHRLPLPAGTGVRHFGRCGQNIVARREELGPFAERRDLLAVPKLGPKAYKQAAGFLRIPGGKNPLDQTAVHPESYPAAKKLLALCGYKPAHLAGGGLEGLGEKLATFSEEALEAATGAGPTP